MIELICICGHTEKKHKHTDESVNWCRATGRPPMEEENYADNCYGFVPDNLKSLEAAYYNKLENNG